MRLTNSYKTKNVINRNPLAGSLIGKGEFLQGQIRDSPAGKVGGIPMAASIITTMLTLGIRSRIGTTILGINGTVPGRTLTNKGT